MRIKCRFETRRHTRPYSGRRICKSFLDGHGRREVCIYRWLYRRCVCVDFCIGQRIKVFESFLYREEQEERIYFYRSCITVWNSCVLSACGDKISKLNCNRFLTAFSGLIYTNCSFALCRLRSALGNRYRIYIRYLKHTNVNAYLKTIYNASTLSK